MINQSPFMEIAIDMAKTALQKDEVPVGAIIVADQKIIAKCCNLVETTNNPTAHAELLAIQEACEKLNTTKLVNCDLYVTLEPCPMCAQAISNARLKRLYYGADDPKSGGVAHGPRIFNCTTCHHKPEVYNGILSQPCATLLKDFFENKRKKST